MYALTFFLIRDALPLASVVPSVLVSCLFVLPPVVVAILLILWTPKFVKSVDALTERIDLRNQQALAKQDESGKRFIAVDPSKNDAPFFSVGESVPSVPQEGLALVKAEPSRVGGVAEAPLVHVSQRASSYKGKECMLLLKNRAPEFVAKTWADGLVERFNSLSDKDRGRIEEATRTIERKDDVGFDEKNDVENGNGQGGTSDVFKLFESFDGDFGKKWARQGVWVKETNIST